MKIMGTSTSAKIRTMFNVFISPPNFDCDVYSQIISLRKRSFVIQSLMIQTCPTACVTCAGADGGTPSTEKKAEARNSLKTAQTPQRRVHALLGAVTS